MAINKIPESQLPTRSVSETDYVRVVGADGKSYRVPKTDFNGGGGGGTIDGSLSPTSTNAVQNKAIYSALEGLKADLGDLSDLDTTVKTDLVSAINEVASGCGGALTQDTKQALLQCFAHTAWTDDQGQDYYDDLEDALYPFDLLSSITAVYTQSGTVYDTDTIDSLKSDLAVTGNYSDSTTNTIRNYTLSGSLTAGTSTITVTYGGKTTTFTVTVTASSATLTSISAVYTQSGTVYDTDSLDSLKADLVVTAHYSDSTTETVASSDYTLSGTLTTGTSTVTVTYSGFTTTFTVAVTQGEQFLYNWDFTQSLVDSAKGETAVLTGCTRNSSGVNFTADNQAIKLTSQKVSIADKTFIFDIPSYTGNDGGSNHTRFFCSDSSDTDTSSGAGGFVYRHNFGWTVYTGSAWGTAFSKDTYPINFFNNKRLKIYIGTDLKLKVSYADIGSDVFTTIGTIASAIVSTYETGYWIIGGSNNNHLQPCTISSVKVYEGEV